MAHSADERRAELQRIIRARIEQALKEFAARKGNPDMPIEAIAEMMRIDAKNLRRWSGQGEDFKLPQLKNAMDFARAASVTLDWLVGRDLSPEETIATVSAHVQDEVEAMHGRLDQLIKELTTARSALIQRASAVKDDDATWNGVERRVARSRRRNERSEPVEPPGEASG